MEARAATAAARPAWLLGAVPLALIAAIAAAFALFGAPGLGDRPGPPVEELAVERTVLRQGEIQMTLRNDGPDAVTINQVAVNDAYVPALADGEPIGGGPGAAAGAEVGRLGAVTLTLPFDWIEGEAIEIFALTSTGGTVEHTIDVAAETPDADVGFFGLMALLGLYVGVIPVSLGMLWLPFAARVSDRWLRPLIAFTVGLLALLGVEALLEGLELADGAPGAFGGPLLVYLGAGVAYLALAGIDAWLRERREPAKGRAKGGAAPAPVGGYLALLVAIGIGLHNLGEGVAIGSAYATGSLALGAFLVIGFALHNTTEGLAIVAPLARERPPMRRLVWLGLIAGAPVILGAWIGALAYEPSIAALLFGVGAGAIAQVIVQLAPAMRDSAGRLLHPAAVWGLLAGVAALYATGLLVSF